MSRKEYILVGLAVAVALGVCAWGLKDKWSGKWESAGPVHADPTFESVAREALSCIEHLHGVVAAVTDRPTARAAAPKVQAITERLRIVQNQAIALGEPSAEVSQKVGKDYGPKLVDAITKLRIEIRRITDVPEAPKELDEVMNGLMPVLTAVIREEVVEAEAPLKGGIGIVGRITGTSHDGKATLSVGARDGVRVGFEFEVVRAGRVAGLVKIVAVEEKQAIAVIASGTGEIKVGDEVRTRP